MSHWLALTGNWLDSADLHVSGHLSSMLVALVLVAALPIRGQALSNTCNGLISISYPSVPANAAVDRVRITLGTGPIQNGNTLMVDNVHFDLACRHRGCNGDITHGCASNADCTSFGGTCMLLLPQNCVADTSTPGTNTVADYVGNITTTCATQGNAGTAITWTKSTPVSTNEIVFTASATIALPHDNAAVCNIEFDIKQLSAQSFDDTPQTIEERAGFDDGACDNGLGAFPRITGSVAIFKETFKVPPPRAAPAIGSSVLVALAVALALAGVVLLDLRTRRRALH